MKPYLLVILLTTLTSISGCQNTIPTDTDIKDSALESTENIESENAIILPTYGSSDTADNPVESLQAGTEGQLTIKNGCVTLTYPKEYYPTATSDNDVIPIFPGGSLVIENGEVLKVGTQLFQNGDFVSLSGSPTVRDFWKSWESEGKGAEYTAVPDNCHALRYWMTGYIKKMDTDRIGR